MSRKQFTPERIRRLPSPRDTEQSFHWDTKAPRLAVRATRAGAKTYVFEKKLNGQTVRVSIGDVQTWPLNSVWEGKGSERREVQREMLREVTPEQRPRHVLDERPDGVPLAVVHREVAAIPAEPPTRISTGCPTWK